jgi:hypothetical protein
VDKFDGAGGAHHPFVVRRENPGAKERQNRSKPFAAREYRITQSIVQRAGFARRALREKCQERAVDGFDKITLSYG